MIRHIMSLLLVLLVCFALSGCAERAASSPALSQDPPSPASGYVADVRSDGVVRQRVIANSDPFETCERLTWWEAYASAPFDFRRPAAESLPEGCELDGVVASLTPAGTCFSGRYTEGLVITIEPATSTVTLAAALRESYQPDLTRPDRRAAYQPVSIGEFEGFGHDLRTQRMRGGKKHNTGSVISWAEKGPYGTYVNYRLYSPTMRMAELVSIAEAMQ